jgi:hypothetical protein
MIAAIVQPSYIPWRGYFHIIHKVDTFVFLDDVQYDKRGWRNRNRIKTIQGPKWLTIPVFAKGAQTEHLLINNIQICWDRPWSHDHWESIRHSYGKAPFFSEVAEYLEPFYSKRWDLLVDFTIELTIRLSGELGSKKTNFLRSSSLGTEGTKTEKLINILNKIGATHYISGPSAKDYIVEDEFTHEGIQLEFMDYDYPEYEQLYPPFDSQVSIIDLLFMQGPSAGKFIF